MYLAPLSGKARVLSHPRLGCVITPESDRGVPEGMPWGADCGLKVARGADRGDLERYLDWLETRPYDRSTCLYAVAPDVLGDAAATWERAAPLLPLIKGLGYRPALVAQDGFDPQLVAWDAFDVLFIGGKPRVPRNLEWKRAEHGGYAAIAEGKKRGKWVHVGRVNGGPFLRQLAAAGADSADGSILTYSPEKCWPLIVSWFDQLTEQPSMLLEAR
jgi:hypothetical protein